MVFGWKQRLCLRGRDLANGLCYLILDLVGAIFNVALDFCRQCFEAGLKFSLEKVSTDIHRPPLVHESQYITLCLVMYTLRIASMHCPS